MPQACIVAYAVTGPAQFGGERRGGRRLSRDVRHGPRRRRLFAGVLPHQVAQAAGQFERGPRVGDGRVDLRPVPDDAGVGEESPDVVRAERGDRGDVESGEGGAEVLALAEDRQPGQPGLERLQAEPLEHGLVAAERPAPLLVVVGEVFGAADAPGAAQPPVGPGGRGPVAHVSPRSAGRTSRKSARSRWAGGGPGGSASSRRPAGAACFGRSVAVTTGIDPSTTVSSGPAGSGPAPPGPAPPGPAPPGPAPPGPAPPGPAPPGPAPPGPAPPGPAP